MAWINPIFDRTQVDVDFAISKIAEWMASDINEGTNSVYDLKGCLNVSDINRIEGNIAFLSKELKKHAYSPVTSTKQWENKGLPTENDIKRILNNIRGLTSAFYRPSDAPDIPPQMLVYTDVNAVEKNLSLIKELLDYMVNSFKKSGTFQSGSKMHLPIRR